MYMLRSTSTIYLALLLLRLYFTFSPSYIHPDEHFQGPEIMAGRVFGYEIAKTWEFTSDEPIRSTVPLYVAFGAPMAVARWLAGGEVDNEVVYYSLRLWFFIMSLAIDAAVYALAPSTNALLRLATSYVTWTFQTHTFTNSLESILVLLSIVFVGRIVKSHEGILLNSAALGVISSFGFFTRITFPAYLSLPAFYLLPQFAKRPSAFCAALTAFILTSTLASYIDTRFYALPFPVITPLNNMRYNSQAANLAQHGLHPRYTHLLANLPQLLGPYLLFAVPPIQAFFRSSEPSDLSRRGCSGVSQIPALSALGALIALSVIPHQEVRFLLPVVPLFIVATAHSSFAFRTSQSSSTTVSFPGPRMGVRWKTSFLAATIVFNLAMGLLMGRYHQGGVVPAVLHLGHLLDLKGPHTARMHCPVGAADAVDGIAIPEMQMQTTVVWWKTYMPPTWLMGIPATTATYADPGASTNTNTGFNVTIVDLMGQNVHVVASHLEGLVLGRSKVDGCEGWLLSGTDGSLSRTFLAAPLSATALDAFLPSPPPPSPPHSDNRALADDPLFELRLVWTYRAHLNLDDMDFGDDGVLPTLERVVGRRGIGIWAVGLRGGAVL